MMISDFTGMSPQEISADIAMRKADENAMATHISRYFDYRFKVYMQKDYIARERKIIGVITTKSNWLELMIWKFARDNDISCYSDESPRCLNYHVRSLTEEERTLAVTQKNLAREWHAADEAFRHLGMSLGAFVHPEWFCFDNDDAHWLSGPVEPSLRP